MALTLFLLGTCGVVIYKQGYFAEVGRNIRAFSPSTVQVGNLIAWPAISGFLLTVWRVEWGGLLRMWITIQAILRIRNACHLRVRVDRKNASLKVVDKRPKPKPEKKQSQPKPVKKLDADQVQKALEASVDARSIVREGNKFTITAIDGKVVVMDVTNGSLTSKAVQIVKRRGARVNDSYRSVPEEPEHVRAAFSN